MYTRTSQIKANVIIGNFPAKCKFQANDQVTVRGDVLDCESKTLRNRIGHSGKVVAVTVAADGKCRGVSPHPDNANWTSARQFTRYYVQFDDGRILGFHSHYLDKA